MPKKRKTKSVVVDDPQTWVRYRKGMCDSCVANCCTMPVEARISDLIRLGLIDEFERSQPAKQLAKRLLKSGSIDHFNGKNEIYTLARRANGDCNFLHPQTRRCTVYDKRPDVCRKHPQVGPRPNHCAYVEKR